MTKAIKYFCFILLLTESGCQENDTSDINRIIYTNYKISNSGSTRATAYVDSNKIFETENWIFMSWLDYLDGKFVISLAKFDKETEELSETVNLDDQVYDNHGGPALLIDSEGYLHIFYGPHHGPISYRKSKKPFDINDWHEKEHIGDQLTYPSVCIDSENTLYLVARHSDQNGPWSLQFFKKRQHETWSNSTDILISNNKKWVDEGKQLYRKSGYVRWRKSLQLDPNGQTLHLLFQNGEYLPTDIVTNYQNDNGFGSYFIGYMKSNDGGNTWLAQNEEISLPATPQSIEIIGGHSEPPEIGGKYSSSNLVINPDGNPCALIIEQFQNHSIVSIATRDETNWQLSKINLDNDDILIPPASFFVDKNGIYYCMITTIDPEAYCLCGGYFGNPSSLLELYTSNDGISFRSAKFLENEKIEKRPIWLPSVNYHQCSKVIPSFMYTAGERGSSPDEGLTTEVYFTKLANEY